MSLDRPLLFSAICLSLALISPANAARADQRQDQTGSGQSPDALASPPLAARPGGIQSLSAQANGDTVEVKAEAFIAAPPEFAFSVFTDYESQPRFIPSLISVKVSDRQGSSMLVDQIATAQLGPFSKQARSIKRATLDPSTLSARMESTPESEVASQSSLRFYPAPGGSRLVYQLSAKTPPWAPQGMAVNMAQKQGREQLSLLIKETERRLASGSAR